MLLADFFIIASNWKQPKFLSTGKWINKARYIHTMEYAEAIRTNGLSIMQQYKCLKNMLSKRSQSKKKNILCSHEVLE